MYSDILKKKEEILCRIEAAKLKGGYTHDVTLVAVTKYHTIEETNDAIRAGIDQIGENHVQALLQKDPLLLDCNRNFIGHLQTNKVKQVVGKVALIQSVDSERLLQAIEAQAEKLGIVQDILLEVNIAGEESKGGCTVDEAESLATLCGTLDHVQLRGLMAIPPISSEPGANRPFFSAMRQLFVDIKGALGDNQSRMDCLSMGMSGDYRDAIQEGATLVRIGTALFGARPPVIKG